MTVTLNPQIEAKLIEKAQREGQALDTLASDVLSTYLEEEEWFAAGVRAAIQSERTKPIAQYIAEQRIKHGYPSDWPMQSAITESRAFLRTMR